MRFENRKLERWRRMGQCGDMEGVFRVPREGVTLNIVCGVGMGWEHVSVSVPFLDRCPTWEEMCFVKDLFWHQDECVVQYHPARKDYVNHHPYTLHLWRPINVALPRPDKLQV